MSRDVERVPRDSSERPGVGTRHFCVGIYGNVRAAARALRVRESTLRRRLSKG